MSVQLVIRDGDPYWYFSPDIWVVPGTSPTGSPGQPIAGKPAYLWAHVANTGSDDATGVRVDFYWANPSLQVLRSNATLVGSANADVPAGMGQDVLCLVPWLPVFVNGGHECLVAVANHPLDPLPSPPPDDFDPPAYRQVAQKNLSVLPVGTQMMMQAITITAGRRQDKHAIVSAEVGGELDATSLARLGLTGFRQATKASVEVGLRRDGQCPDGEARAEASGKLGDRSLEVTVPRGESAGVFAAIRASGLGSSEYQLVRLTERRADAVVGGLALVVVAAK